MKNLLLPFIFVFLLLLVGCNPLSFLDKTAETETSNPSSTTTELKLKVYDSGSPDYTPEETTNIDQ